MQLTHLEIFNFRGIKSSNISFSIETRLLCMIGAGDGTKTTLLKAIEWILCPTWNLNVSSTDFYNSDTSVNIILRGTFTEIPKVLLSEDKYGLYLRKQGFSEVSSSNDEPVDSEPVCLTIQLTIDSSLEPKWEVICNRKEPKTISYKDRKQLVVGCVGSNCDKDMVWCRSSVLQKYANSKGILQEVYNTVFREVADLADFHKLDEVSATIREIGSEYGVELTQDVRNRLMMQSSAYSSSVGLFEDGAPLSQRGLGSQRLLSMGLNINSTTDGALLLIDELETGLEPYRIRNLINLFRTKHSASGQIIMTTHSPTVLSECTIQELLIIQSNDGVTSAYPLHSTDEKINENMQKQVRRNSEAFLCKQIIVCEGRTEIGFIRAMDNLMSTKHHYRMAFEGTGTADGGGANVFECAAQLAQCGYRVCIFMDSDLDGKESKKKEAKDTYNIDTFDWDSGNSIEEQLFYDITKPLAEQILKIAVEEKGIESITARIKDIPHTIDDNLISLNTISDKQQRMIGTIAKDKKAGWYKRIDLGEKLGKIIFDNWDDIKSDTTTHKTIAKLINWVSSK